MKIEEVLDVLDGTSGASAYVCDAGVFLRRHGRVVERLSEVPPASKFPRGVLAPDKVHQEVERNNGACDIAYSWRGARVVNAVRRVGGELTVEIRVYPKAPPDCSELGMDDILPKLNDLEGGIVLVAGGRGSGRTTTAMAICRGLVEGRFISTLEDPVTYRLPNPEKGVVAQREVGIYGDVPSFNEGLRQAAATRPDVLYVSEAPDGDCARRLVVLAGGGTLVICEAFGMDPSDAVRRLVLKGEQGLAADTGQGWRQGFLEHLSLVLFCPYTSQGVPTPKVIEDLAEIKNEWMPTL